jgi:hypothetical protein
MDGEDGIVTLFEDINRVLLLCLLVESIKHEASAGLASQTFDIDASLITSCCWNKTPFSRIGHDVGFLKLCHVINKGWVELLLPCVLVLSESQGCLRTVISGQCNFYEEVIFFYKEGVFYRSRGKYMNA